jgi:uncharacterized protein
VRPALDLTLLEGRLAICRLGPEAPLPAWALGPGALISLTRTPEQLSLVCPESVVPGGIRCEGGWRALRVAGPLDFALTGILAALTQPLAEAGIPIFALSTFDTDYVLVKEDRLEAALAALRGAGHRV